MDNAQEVGDLDLISKVKYATDLASYKRRPLRDV